MRRSWLKFVRVVGLFLGWGAVAAAATTTWTTQASGTSQDLWGICFGNQLAVAVGTGGTVLTSPDGATWTTQASGTTAWLVSVTFAARLNLFVAVGDQGVILTSPDGVTWTQRASGGPRLNGVACDTNAYPVAGVPMLVAVGEGGAMVSSNDAITWTAGNSGVTGWLHGITYANNYVMVGQNAAMQLSTFGQTAYPLNPMARGDIEAIASGPDLALAAGANGYIGSSYPGIWNWAPVSVPGSPHFQGLAMGASSEYVAVGLLGVIDLGYGSVGQVHWVPADSGTSADLYSVAWITLPGGAARAVAVGAGGAILTAPFVQGPPVSAGIVAPATPAFGTAVTLAARPPDGLAPFAYQWSLNGKAIPGATTASYTIPSASLGTNGSYTLTITNAAGSQTLTATVAATAQPAIPGLVDESFAPNVPIDPYGIETVAVEPDGKVLVGESALQRLNPDGSVDPAFTQNASGIALITALGTPAGYYQVLQQANGQLVVTGGGVTAGTAKAPYTVSHRINPDGTPDSSYTPTVQVGAFATSDVDLPMVQLGDGRYLTALTHAASGPSVVRLTVQGALDPAWTAYSPPGAPMGASATLQMDAQGRILMIAENSSVQVDGVGGQTFVCRLNADGSFDPTFVPQTFAGGLQIFPQASGALVYENSLLPGGQSGNGAGTLVIGRLTAAGTTDASYPGLSLPIAFGAATTSAAWTPGPGLLAADGSLYLWLYPVSTAGVPMPLLKGTYRNGVIRIDSTGQLDLGYSLNVDLRSSDGNPPRITGMALAPGGQWVVWGSFSSFNGEPHADLVRINPQAGQGFAGLVNLSARAAAGTGSQALAVGFVTTGANPTGMLLRGIGPGLAQFGVMGLMADPQIQLFDGTGDVVAADDNWQDGGQGSAVAAAGGAVGAFALPLGSLDAALLASVPAGSHSMVVSGGAGNAMAEAYDTDPGAPTFAGNRAVNFSFRGPVGTGSSVLTAGIVVAGGNSRRVLIRAIGPGLAPFGVAGAVPDPQLTVYSGSNVIAQAGAWANDAALSQTFAAVGAFSLQAGSADAALILTLAPGAYTVQAASKSGASGVALVEVYEVP